jgi:hypothetical protein
VAVRAHRTWGAASAGLVVAALIGVTSMLASSSGNGGVAPAPADDTDSTAVPASATPSAADNAQRGCPVAAATPLPAKSPQCSQAQLVATWCRPEPGTLALVSDTGGEAAWTFSRDGRTATASTDSDRAQAVGLLSCGSPTNGIDASAMLAAVRKEAETGWRISVGSVACASRSGHPVDELPVGESAIWCEVLDHEGNGSAAFVSVISESPHFVVHLGE